MRHSRHSGTLPTTLLITGLAIAGGFALLADHDGGVPAQREVTWLKQLAAEGDSGAQLQLGLAYREGRYGLATDPRTGLHWLTAAARNGDAYAADLTGNAYAAGEGTPRDTQQALHWWQVAADAGNADAQTRLGEAMLAEGQSSQGTDWLRDAADRGDARAHADLTHLYRMHAVSDADLHRGENPLAALAERLDARGIDAMFAAWHTIETNTPPVESGERLRYEAHQGDPVAEYQLGLRYRDGSWDVMRNPQKASFWLQRSADAGNPVAAQTLADDEQSANTGPAGTAPPLAPDIYRI